jgi:NADH:ubiquinone oxidoreductase subunit F (NADH-binding)
VEVAVEFSLGSGGLVCMDEDTCMVDMAPFLMEFVQEESCGKCIPCRLGTKGMLNLILHTSYTKREIFNEYRTD